MGKLGKLFFNMVILSMIVTLAACGREEQVQTGTVYEIYYVNNDETRIINRQYVTESEDTEVLFTELAGQLQTRSEKMEYQSPLSGEFSIRGHVLDSGLLTLDFDEKYKELWGTKEVLVRAAIVRTLVQIPGVERITFTVEGEPLVDSSGVAVGIMTADTFIENAGNEINAYEKVNLRLYFANEEGNLLVEENQRNVVYNSNISLEKLVVEKLIEGPKSEGSYPTINPAAKIVSVTVKDGICYVNLDEAFQSQPYNVTSEVTIYSITNSLVELSNVNKVQISINGETNISYRENMSLNNVYERNLDLLTVK